jgi:hypothetical protein
LVFREEDLDDEDSFELDDQYDCTSQCEDPCTNQKHLENKNFVNIIEKALRENNFDTESVESQRFYKQIISKANAKHSKPLFMRQSPKEDEEEEEEKKQTSEVSEFNDQKTHLSGEKGKLKLDMNKSFVPTNQ